MRLFADKIVFSSDNIQDKAWVSLDSDYIKASKKDILFENAIIYPALINAHDHLVGNWYPPAISPQKFPNSHIWVEQMKDHPTYLDRNKYWKNDGSFILTKDKEMVLCQLGVYKNLFSGVVAVQDHAPKQADIYYDSFPINVIRDYTQCHSLPLGNWWGGGSAEEEFAKSKSSMPFIVHLGEGTDEITANEFSDLKARGLLAKNTLMIHGIALTRQEIKEIAQVGASICWCPVSNDNLIGAHLDIDACLEYNANVVIATDSTLSGSINLFAEMKFSRDHFPQVSSKDIFEMVTSRPAKALYLPKEYGSLENASSQLLVIDKCHKQPFENIINAKSENIKLLLHKNKPLLGDLEFLDNFDYKAEDYSFYNVGKRKKFVIGNYQKLTNYINSFLDYQKTFPYLPQ